MQKLGSEWKPRPGEVCVYLSNFWSFDAIVLLGFQAIRDSAMLQFGEGVLNSINWRERDDIGPKLKEYFEKVRSLHLINLAKTNRIIN